MAVVIFGAGSWGTALAQSLAQKGESVTLWARDAAQVQGMTESRENKAYLPGVTLDGNITITDTIPEEIDVAVIAIPTQKQRAFLVKHRSLLVRASAWVNVAKGIEVASGACLSEVYAEIFGEEMAQKKYVALYGPSHAEEVGCGMPTALVAAAYHLALAERIQSIFMQPNLRVYTNDDLIGVELGGALKNIIALAIGMTVGLGQGDNVRAALMTRGLAEITRLGVALGANPLTFLGLTGVGDLIVTCTSEHSRNRSAGLQLGKGKRLHEVLQEMGMVVEGVETTRAAYQKAQAKEISMPIVEAMYDVLFHEKDPQEATYALMTRSKKSETEDFLRLQ